MFCRYCGKENGDNQNFCTNCGKSLRMAEENMSDAQDGVNQSNVHPNGIYQNTAPQNNVYQNDTYQNAVPHNNVYQNNMQINTHQDYTEPKKVTLLSAYVDFFKRYADFGGRSTRSEYWYVYLVNFIIGIISGLIINMISSSMTADGGAMSPLAGVLLIVLMIYSFAVIIPGMALLVRRLHDIGKSGWNWFICLIPIVGNLIMLVFLATDSQFGANKYGLNPKGIGNNY